jgi:hypothetical protein
MRGSRPPPTDAPWRNIAGVCKPATSVAGLRIAEAASLRWRDLAARDKAGQGLDVGHDLAPVLPRELYREQPSRRAHQSLAGVCTAKFPQIRWELYQDKAGTLPGPACHTTSTIQPSRTSYPEDSTGTF